MDTKDSGEIILSQAAKRIQLLIKYLISKWLIIGCIAFGGCAIGVIYAWVMKDKYKAVLTFSVEDNNSTTTLGLAGIAAQFGINMGSSNDIFSGNNVLALMQSRRIVAGALFTNINYMGSTTSLLNLYLRISGMQKGMNKSKLLKNIKFPEAQNPQTYSRLQDSILLVAVDNITKANLNADQPDKKIEIYELTCISPDEIFSSQMCNQIVSQTTDFYISTKTKQARETVDILQNRADSVKRAYDEALTGRAVLSDANLNPAFQTPVVDIQRKQTDITVLSTAYGELLKNLELAKFNLLQETPLIQVIDSPLLPLENKKLGRLLGGIIFAFVFGTLAICWYTLRFLIRYNAETLSL